MDRTIQDRPGRRLFVTRFIARGQTVREAMHEADVIDLAAYRRRKARERIRERSRTGWTA